MGNNGVLTNSIPYPAVSRKQSRIRMTVTSEMTAEHLNKGYFELCSALDTYQNDNEEFKENGQEVLQLLR